MTPLVLVLLSQIDVYNAGTYVGRSANAIDCVGATCSITGDGGAKRVRVTVDAGSSGGGGSGPSPSGLCGDGGSALGWDGGAFYCASTVKAGSCSAGQYVTAISASGAPTCGTVFGDTADGGSAEGWHSVGGTGEPAFQSSWVNYDTATYFGAGFRIEDGRVFLRGLIKSGTVAPGCDQYIFTLPSTHRPPRQVNLATVANGLFAFVGVKADGNVCAASGSNAWWSLDGISFSLTQ